MAQVSWHKWLGVGLVAAILLLAAWARRPYLQQANLSPDAADYLNIARNIARGHGLVHSIKWHFFTNDPVVHSAIGERPLLYPLLLAPFCRGDLPARVCQCLTLLITVVALALAAAWARRLNLDWRVVTISAAVLAFNPGVLMCSVYPWTESLYLVWLFGVLLVVGGDASVKLARIAAVLTALAVLTRPSAAAIVLGLCAWYAWKRAFPSLAHYLATLLALLLPWWLIVWIARGNPFYSTPAFHLVVKDIHEGMELGYGVVFPRPIGFIFTNAPALAAKAANQAVVYLVHLLGPTYLLLFSAFLFLWPFRRANDQPPSDGPWFALALFHFILPALVWATFDAVRFMLPTFAILVVPAVAAADRVIANLATRRARLSAWLAILAATGFFYANQWQLLYSRFRPEQKRDQSLQITRIELDQWVEPDAILCGDDPFSFNYYFDRPTIMLPQPPDAAQRVEILGRFLDEYRPDYFLLKPAQAQALSALVARGRLRPIGILTAQELHVLRVAPPSR